MPNDKTTSDYNNGNGNRRKFHFERSISLGHVMQAVALIGAAAAGYFSLSERITTLEVTQSFTERTLTQIARELNDINRKIDRRWERGQ